MRRTHDDAEHGDGEHERSEAEELVELVGGVAMKGSGRRPERVVHREARAQNVMPARSAVRLASVQSEMPMVS